MNATSILNESKHAANFVELLKSNFGTVNEARKCGKLLGIYVLFEDENALYVGRTNKSGLGPRMKQHLSPYHNRAVFAFKLAREELGIPTAYSGNFTRNNLMKDPKFKDEFRRQIQRVSEMSVKFVEMLSPDDQYIFEFYASKRLNTKYNNFNTH